MISKITETKIINQAPEIMKSTVCPITLEAIYGNTAIKAKNDQPNRFKWAETFPK